MPRRRCQLRVRDPNLFLFLPLLARPHRHAPILQTKPVDTSTLSAHESELAPRAANVGTVQTLPTTKLLSSTVDPAIQFLPNNNQYAYYAAPSVPRRNLLVVDLPGSNETCPAAASFDDTAQRLGFDVICVNYSNLSSQNNICTGDPDCYGKVSQAKLDATSVCSIPGQSQCGIDPKTGRPYYLNNPADAVTQRISMMLQYLNTHGYNKNGTNWVTISQAQLLFGKILSWEGILRAEICRPSPPIRIRSRERSICRPHQRPH